MNAGAEQLRERIEVRGQKVWLARELGVHPSSVSRWLNGGRKPDCQTRVALLVLLEIPLGSWDEPSDNESRLDGHG